MLLMLRRRVLQLRRALFLATVFAVALIATARVCQAHSDDDNGDDDSTPPKPSASLNLNFDSRGHADVHLSLDQTPSDWRPIQVALGQTLHCSPEAFAHPANDSRASRNWSPANPEQRRKYEKFLNDASQRQVQASCNDVLAASGWTVSGTLPLQPLAESLAQAGEQQLFVSVQRPKAAFDEYSSQGLPANGDSFRFLNQRFLSYSFALGATTTVPPLHLAYGYRRADVLRQCARSAGFLLLPLLLILWMRRAALKDAVQDPTAAWFSYFKTLQWCVNGTMLLWMVARTSLRQGVQDLIAFRLPAGGWQSAVASTLVVMVPPLLVYLICLFLSYKVYVQLRGNHWTRGQFMLERSLEVGAQFLPFMFFFCALDFLTTSPKLLVVLMLAAYVSRVLCVRAKMKVSGVSPEALTTGELRDRMFDLAKRAGVAIKQVFVVGAGRAQIANAYATSAQTVMFTDYLLQRLTKREVDAIAGHELSHLRCGHPKKLGLALIGVILFPSIFRGLWTVLTGWIGGILLAVSGGNRDVLREWYRWSPKFIVWSQLDLALMIAGFGLFYLLSRRFERVADEGSVQLVNDPEAMITALLKVSRLNLTPIQWGKVTGSLLTHPSTLRRIEHIASVGNVPQDRVQQLLAHHTQEEQARRAGLSPAPVSDPATGAASKSTFQSAAISSDEHYAFPPGAKNVVSTVAVARRATNNMWLLVGVNVLPPAVVAWTVNKLNLHGNAAFVAYLGGVVAIVAGYSLLGLALSLRGRQRLRQQFTAKFDREGILIRGRNALLTGFAPGPSLRVYLAGFDWDHGFVWLLQNRMVYLGDKLRFALTPEQITSVRVGQSAPGWWNSERVYLDWRDPDHGRQGTFSLYPNEPSSAGKIKSEGKALCAALQRWQGKSVEYPVAPPSVQSLESPILGEVTSQDLKDRLSGGKRLNSLILLLLLSYGASLLLGVHGWYGFGVVLLLRIYERIPYWLYRAPTPPTTLHQQPQVARAQAGGQ